MCEDKVTQKKRLLNLLKATFCNQSSIDRNNAKFLRVVFLAFDKTLRRPGTSRFVYFQELSDQ